MLIESKLENGYWQRRGMRETFRVIKIFYILIWNGNLGYVFIKKKKKHWTVHFLQFTVWKLYLNENQKNSSHISN